MVYAPRGGEFRVNTRTGLEQEAPDVAVLTNGGFVVAWQDHDEFGTGGDSGGFGVKAQIYDGARGLLLAVLSALAVTGPARAQAQPPAEASADEKILAGLERGRKDREGLVVIAAEIPGQSCSGVDVVVGRTVEGRLQKITIPGMFRIFGNYKNFAPKGLAAGPWVLGSVKCVNLRGGGMVLNGPYAKFDVVAGETIDAGTLKVEYKSENYFAGTGTVRLSVQPTNEGRTAELKKTIPRVMARARKSHMVLIGPPERKMERSRPRFTPGPAKEPGEMFQR